MIIDIHTHLGSDSDKARGMPTFKKNLAALQSEMKKSKVDIAFLLAWLRSDNKNPDVYDLLKLADSMKEFRVIGSLDILTYTRADLAKLESLIRQKKIIGIKLYTGYQHFYPNDKRAIPIYKLCLKYDIPVIYHSGDTVIYETYAKVKYSHPLHIDEIAVDFPKLKIIIAHMGNPWLVDCAEILYRHPNVYADVSGLIVVGNNESLGADYGNLARQKIKELITYSSPRKLLYGSDWPLSPLKPYINFVKSLECSKTDFDYIFYKNAVNLFKIKL